MIDEPTAEQQDRAHYYRELEADQAAYEATLEVESDEHVVARHSEFYPLDVDTRGWTLAEVEAVLGITQ